MKRKRDIFILTILILTILIDATLGLLINSVRIALPFRVILPLIIVCLLGYIGIEYLKRRAEAGIEHSTGMVPGNRDRQRLLDRVHLFWIAGVLEPSLLGSALIALGLHESLDAIDHPMKPYRPRGGQPRRPLPSGATISQAYDAAQGELLILGGPGTGKTTLLLELARELIERAKQDEQHPIPIVFHLSSWATKQQPLTEWLVEELNTMYQVPPAQGQSWVHTEQILPLLDGFDEVASKHLSACVKAINTFRNEHHGLVPLVVCSRKDIYFSQAERFVLHTAVVIKPLTKEQVDAYLLNAGQPMMAVRSALKENSVLQELATTPLIISVLKLAYQGNLRGDLPKSGTREEQIRQVTASYVEQMFEHKRASSCYTPQQTVHWLSWLAGQLRHHDQAEFYIERMQPDWLPESSLRRTYRLGIALIFVLCFGLVGGIVGGLVGNLIGSFAVGSITGRASARSFLSGLAPWPIEHFFGGLVAHLSLVLVAGSVAGLIAGVGLGLIFGILTGLTVGQAEITPSEAVEWSWEKAMNNGLIGGLVGILIGWVGIGSIAELTIGLVKGWVSSLIYGPIGGLGFGLVAGLVVDLLRSMVDYHPLVKLKPEKPDVVPGRFRFKVGIGLGGGLVIGLVVGSSGTWIREWIYGLVGGVSNTLAKMVIFGLLYGLVLGLVVAVTMAIAGGWSSHMLKTREPVRPNHGIRTSARNSFRYGLCGAFFMGVSAGVVGGSTSGSDLGLVIGLIGGLIGGLIAGLLYGGVAWIQHVVLRTILWRAGYTPRPWEYISFLDNAAERILLRKVGGGYIFVHRRLMEYFASLDATVAYPEQHLSRREVLTEIGGVVLAAVVGSAMYWLLAPRSTLAYTYHGHTSDVRMVAWSPNGRRIASASWDHTVQVWNALDGMHVLRYPGHTHAVTAVAWSPDGKFIASGSDDSSVQIWQAASGKYVLSCRGHRDRIESLAWSPDGKFIASGNWDNHVYVWSATNGSLLQTYKGHHDHVWSIAWSPDGTLIASASWDHTVQVWNASTGRTLQIYQGHLDQVFGLAWSHDGNLIASGSADKTVQVWKVLDGEPLMVYRGHGDPVWAVAWSPDGKFIASGGADNSVQIWNATDGWFLMTYTHSDAVISIAWSPNSEYIASGSGDNTVQIHRRM